MVPMSSFPSVAPPLLGRRRRDPEDGLQLIIHEPVEEGRYPVAGIPPVLQVGVRREPAWREDVVVCRDIPPPVQSLQVSEAGMVGRIGRDPVERDAKPVEVLPNVVSVRVAAIQREARCKLRLNHELQRGGHRRADDLGTFGIEVPAEALEVVLSNRM